MTRTFFPYSLLVHSTNPLEHTCRNKQSRGLWVILVQNVLLGSTYDSNKLFDHLSAFSDSSVDNREKLKDMQVKSLPFFFQN